MEVTIYHNPACSNSRAALGLIREAGIEPTIIEYLKMPMDRNTLGRLIQEMQLPVRDVVRQKETLYSALALHDANDDALLAAMLAHPGLINRPIVVTPLGTRLCRPPESVLDLLPAH